MIFTAKNFYYYEKEPIDGPFPAGQIITTQSPGRCAKIRIEAIFALTAALIYKAGSSVWRWPVACIGIAFAAYTAYKHLLTEDPLVEAFYKIAGDKDAYDGLPEIKLDTDDRICDKFAELQWADLKHPMCRFATSDGRKGLLVKGLKDSVDSQPYIKAMMIFVEKIGPYDVVVKDMPEWLASIFVALGLITRASLVSENLRSDDFSITRGELVLGVNTKHTMYASISADLANEFIAQRGTENTLEVKIHETGGSGVRGFIQVSHQII